jgi:hypothetical protein
MDHRQNLALHGVEPVDELRSTAYGKGIPRNWLSSGNGPELPFPDSRFYEHLR